MGDTSMTPAHDDLRRLAEVMKRVAGNAPDRGHWHLNELVTPHMALQASAGILALLDDRDALERERDELREVLRRAPFGYSEHKKWYAEAEAVLARALALAATKGTP